MENPFHQYKDIIGKPGEGAHSYRFLGFAVVDTVTVIIVALLVAWYFKLNVWYTLVVYFSGLLYIGCTNTSIIWREINS